MAQGALRDPGLCCFTTRGNGNAQRQNLRVGLGVKSIGPDCILGPEIDLFGVAEL